MKGTSEKWRRFLRYVQKKRCVEMMLCLFLLVSIAAHYCIDVLHILPHVYRQLPFRYLIHVLPLTFVVFNVLANFLAVVFIDSSVIGRLLTVSEYSLKGMLMVLVIFQLKFLSLRFCMVSILFLNGHLAGTIRFLN